MPDDDEIFQTVLGELQRDGRLAAASLRVEVRNGVVTLFGTVEGYALRGAARAAAERVPGVAEVVTRIKVTLSGGASGQPTQAGG